MTSREVFFGEDLEVGGLHGIRGSHDLGPVDVVPQAGEQADVVGEEVLGVIKGDGQGALLEVAVFL